MVRAQLGGPLLNITFGEAPTDKLDVPGPRLPKGFTAIPYTSDVCPAPGSYTVVSGITTSCFQNAWIPVLSDNTPYPDNNGYMMLIHDVASFTPKIIFRDTLRDLCNQVNYQFSVAIINVSDARAGCTRFSSITLQVEDDLGNVLGSTNTGDIQYAVYAMGYHFNKYAVNFMVPPTAGAIVVKLIDNAKSTAGNCSNAIAIDDIKVAVVGPQVSIAFDNTLTGDWVKSSCFQDNKSFTMSGNVEPGFANPAVQWQQSTDNGITWDDIPGATGYTCTQQFSVPDTFLFRLRAADASLITYPYCGVSSNQLKVQVDGIPTDISATSNSPVCAGQDLIFNAMGGASYSWSGPNGFSDNVYYAHIPHSALADSGTYYVDITSLGGCIARKSVAVKMIGTDVSAGNDTAVCKGKPIQLMATAGGTEYSWSPATGLSKTTISNPVAAPESSTTYTVEMKDAFGCTGTASIKIKVLNKVALKAAFDASETLCRFYDSASFKNTSLGNSSTWHWSFGNGQTSDLRDPPVQYYSMQNNETSFTAQLIIKDTSGCTDTAYHIMKVANNCFIAVPSAFTPNGDGANDFLYPLNAYKASHLVFRVFNRMGQLIFESKDLSGKWDGSIRGNPQPAGTYVWMLDYTDPAGKKISLRGTTVLLR